MKTLKNLFLSLLLVPMIFMFTACGDGGATNDTKTPADEQPSTSLQLETKAVCSTSGDYVKSDDTISNYTTAIEGKTSLDASTYRFTIEMKYAEQNINVEMNAILAKKDGGKYDMAMKMNTPNENGIGTVTSYIYVLNDKVYMNSAGIKVYYDSDGQDVEELMSNISSFVASMEQYSKTDFVFEMLNADNMSNYEIYQNGNNYKIESKPQQTESIEPVDSDNPVEQGEPAQGEDFDDLSELFGDSSMTVYLNFSDDDKLTALNYTMNFLGMEIIGTFSAFDEEIEFPDFSSYKKGTLSQ